MAQLTADFPREFEYNESPLFNDVPVAAAAVIYEGSGVGIQTSGNTGFARQFTPPDEFAGFCERKADNTGGANGARYVDVRQQGIVQANVTGVSAASHVNDPVYMTDGNTFTLTGSAGIQVGFVHRWIAGTLCMVRYQAKSVRSV